MDSTSRYVGQVEIEEEDERKLNSRMSSQNSIGGFYDNFAIHLENRREEKNLERRWFNLSLRYL